MKNTKLKRLAVGTLIAFILAMFALGGIGVTAYAAQDTLPGDALYAVKTGMERSRIVLTSGVINKAKLNIQFADHRLDEMLQLAEQERYEDMGAAVAEFRDYTGRAIDALVAIAIATDPVQAHEMSILVAGLETRQSLVLNQLAASLPENARPVLQKALATAGDGSQTLTGNEVTTGSGMQYHGTVESITDTSWMIDGVSYAVDGMTIIEGSIQVGDPVEFYVFSASDGTQTLWKVELSTSSDGMGEDNDDSMETSEQDDSIDDGLMEDDYYDDNYQNGGMYSDDDQEDNGQLGNTMPYYDSKDDDQEENQSGQYYDDHEDDHSQNSSSDGHSSEHDDGDQGGHDD